MKRMVTVVGRDGADGIVQGADELAVDLRSTSAGYRSAQADVEVVGETANQW